MHSIHVNCLRLRKGGGGCNKAWQWHVTHDPFVICLDAVWFSISQKKDGNRKKKFSVPFFLVTRETNVEKAFSSSADLWRLIGRNISLFRHLF